MIHACRWLLAIDRPPVEGAWVEIEDGRIRRVGQGTPPGRSLDLGDVALLPGLVNAHTHLELSWLEGRIPPAESLDAWILSLMRLRRSESPSVEAQLLSALRAAAAMRAAGTALVGDVSNTLATPDVLVRAGLGGVVFHELLGFRALDPERMADEAHARAGDAAAGLSGVEPAVTVTIAAHAPYSVSPALFRAVADRASEGPLTVHLAESADEVEFLRSGTGAIREMIETLGAWTDDWSAPRTGPVDYLASVGYLRAGLLAVHGVHLTDDELDRLRDVGAAVVTCPRSNLWVGGGLPRVSHFYAAGVPVAIGTDSLASVGSLSLFDELAELRRIAPDVAAASLLDSATRVGARVLGFGETHGTIAPGKSGALTVVDVPAGTADVEEYLVSGVPPSAVRPLS